MDDDSYSLLLKINIPEVIAISLIEFEKGDGELAKAKKNRSRVEYYFTCTPKLPLYILGHNPDVHLITYLDSDIYFFSDLKPVYEEINRSSIAIIAHRFPQNLKRLLKFGKYNVGWITFRRDESGLACLTWWRDRCNEWCYDRVEQTRYADQKYLDYWPELFTGVKVIQHKGANVAPWNVMNYKIDLCGSNVCIDGQLLIFYHFQGVKKLVGRMYDAGVGYYKTKLSKTLRSLIYEPYISILQSIEMEMLEVEGFKALRTNSIRQKSFLSSLIRKIRALLQVIIPGNYIIVDNRKDIQFQKGY